MGELIYFQDQLVHLQLYLSTSIIVHKCIQH